MVFLRVFFFTYRQQRVLSFWDMCYNTTVALETQVIMILLHWKPMLPYLQVLNLVKP